METVIFQFSSILAGFSIISCLMLLFTYLLFFKEMKKTSSAKIACSAVLLGLVALQLSHYLFFAGSFNPLASRLYCAVLMMMPIAFFFFGREALFLVERYRWLDLLHSIPFVICLVLPLEWVPGVAFLVGTVYTFWFVKNIFELRSQSGRFKFEIFFFGMFALMAFAALILGLALPLMDSGVFYLAYSNSISIAVLLIVTALLIFPELLADILLVTELAYAKSKLADVDVDGKLADIERLMTQEKLYENEELSLSMLADEVGLSSHQLSELINTEYGYGYPRFVREHRVRAARSLLVNEPNSSVLAISMAIGFKSQSSFYTAFKEATGESPGNYRSKRLC